MKNQRGITLVALIITVIIMLILAGVTIWMATSQDGLVKKVENAVQNVQLKVDEQDDALNTLENRLDRALQGDYNTTVGA